MDFYARAKDELIRAMPERECCKISELCGLIKADGVVRIASGRMSLSIRESSAAVARKIVALLKDVSRPEVQVAVAKGRGLVRGKAYIVRLPRHDEAVRLLDVLGLSASSRRRAGRIRELLRTTAASAPSSGVFLGSGYMSLPGKGYHLEINVETEGFAEFLSQLIGEFGVRTGIVQRRKRYVSTSKTVTTWRSFCA